MHDAAQPRPASNSIQLNVPSDMNEHLASKHADFIAELVKLQHRQRQQDGDEGHQKQGPSLVAGIPAHQLVCLLSLPGTSPVAQHLEPFSPVHQICKSMPNTGETAHLTHCLYTFGIIDTGN